MGNLTRYATKEVGEENPLILTIDPNFQRDIQIGKPRSTFIFGGMFEKKL